MQELSSSSDETSDEEEDEGKRGKEEMKEKIKKKKKKKVANVKKEGEGGMSGVRIIFTNDADTPVDLTGEDDVYVPAGEEE